MLRFVFASLLMMLAGAVQAADLPVTPESREKFYSKIESAPAPGGGGQEYSQKDLENGIDIATGWRLYVRGRGHVALQGPDGYYTHIYGDPVFSRSDNLEGGGAYGEFRRSTEILALCEDTHVCLHSVDGKGVQDNWGYVNEVWVLAPTRAIHVWSIWHNDGACKGKESFDPFYVQLELANRSFVHGHTFNFNAGHYLAYNGSHFVDPDGNFPSNHGGTAATKSELFAKLKNRPYDPKVLLGAKPELAASLGVTVEDLQQMLKMRQALAAGLRPVDDPVSKRGTTDAIALRKAAGELVVELRSQRGRDLLAER
jgi:hypothetical protein